MPILVACLSQREQPAVAHSHSLSLSPSPSHPHSLPTPLALGHLSSSSCCWWCWCCCRWSFTCQCFHGHWNMLPMPCHAMPRSQSQSRPVQPKSVSLSLSVPSRPCLTFLTLPYFFPFPPPIVVVIKSLELLRPPRFFCVGSFPSLIISVLPPPPDDFLPQQRKPLPFQHYCKYCTFDVSINRTAHFIDHDPLIPPFDSDNSTLFLPSAGRSPTPWTFPGRPNLRFARRRVICEAIHRST